MSYILDALKKAEAQRHLGGVPTIHAAAPGEGGTAGSPPFWRRNLAWLIAGLLALLLAGYVLWSQPWRHGEPAPAAASAAIAPASPVSEPMAPVAALPLEPRQTEPAPAQATPSGATQAAPAVAAGKPARAAQPVTSPVTSSIAPPAAPAPAETPKTVTPPAAASAASASTASPAPAAQEEEAGTIQDLPASIQRELPPVSITGYLYAKNPADRSALINKRLLHEGDAVAPDLVLERLTPKGAVLNYKGYRYRISY